MVNRRTNNGHSWTFSIIESEGGNKIKEKIYRKIQIDAYLFMIIFILLFIYASKHK